jgi:hypothetical protein
MKNRTLQGDDFYPSFLAGIKGGQFRSSWFRSEVKLEEEPAYERIQKVCELL